MNKYQSQSKARLSDNVIDPVDVLMAIRKEALEQHRRAAATIRTIFSPQTQPESIGMDRIDHLIDTFRVDHPDVDPAILSEFAEHVRRVLIDELRADLKTADAPVQISMQLQRSRVQREGPAVVRRTAVGRLGGSGERAVHEKHHAKLQPHEIDLRPL